MIYILHKYYNLNIIIISKLHKNYFCFKKFVDVPGCLASSDNTLMNILITKTQKEVLATMNKMLIDILSTGENLKLREKLKPKLTTRISAHSLKKLVNKFKDIDDLYIISESSKKLQVRILMKS